MPVASTPPTDFAELLLEGDVRFATVLVRVQESLNRQTEESTWPAGHLHQKA